MSVTKKPRLPFIALILLISLLTSVVFPYGSVFASPANPGEGMPKPNPAMRPSVSSTFPKMDKQSRIEIPTKRTAQQQEFLNSDGSFTVEVYPQPIHWKNKHGQWVNIDNNLIQSKDNPSFAFKNASNDLQIWFAQNISNQAVNRIQHGDLYVEFVPENNQPSVGLPKENKISYKNIYPHVDMNYTVSATGVKEEIVLASASAANTFTFSVNTQGLTPKANKNGTISFMDKDDKEVFVTAKPFAFDSKGSATENVASSLRQEGNKWYIDVILDSAWLTDAARVFPVTIDPTITFSPMDANIQDTFAASSYPDINYSANTWLAAGTNTYGINRSYIWFNLPKLYSGAQITSASLNLYQFVSSSSNTTIDVHRITSPWSATALTWNDKPAFDEAVIASKTDTSIGTWNFDVTNTVKDWYDANLANYGLMLKANQEASDRRGFYASNNGANIPALVINYIVDPTGAEDFWSYAGNVNVQNGNLLITDNDVFLDGKGVPISISRSYNSRAGSMNSVYGYGWQFNVGMSLKYQDPYNSKVILFTDGDGTKHVFTETDGQDGVWDAPPGIDLTLSYQSGTPAYYIITDKSQTKYYFDSNTKKLEAVIDSNNNVTDLAYNPDGTLNHMTDASGRTVNFTYANGKLDTITGNEIRTVDYSYNGSGDLTSVSILNASGTPLQTIQYGYDANHNLTTITDPKGNSTRISYYTTDRVDQISQDVTVAGVVNTYVTDYGYSWNNDAFITTVIDPKGVATRYSTNGNGNVIEVIEDYGTGKKNITTELTWDTEHHLTEEIDPRLKKTIFTYENGNLEKISNPKNQSQTMKYDSHNNVTLYKGYNGETAVNHYDAKDNKTSELNTLAGTSINKFNSAGDLIQTTAPISVSDNIVVNNGFEQWGASLPDNWYKIGTTGTISRETNIRANGNYSAKMVSTDSSNKAVLASEYLPVKGNTMYNASWFINASNITGSADIKVEWYSGTTYLSSSTGLSGSKGTMDWNRKGARVKSDPSADHARIVMTVDTGTAYFDNVQLEEGSYINEVNYVVNEGYEQYNADGVPDVWDIVSGSLGANDKIDLTKYHTGKSSVLLNGTSGVNKYYGQNLNISGEAGTSLHYSGYSTAAGVNPNGGDYMLLLHVDYVSPTAGSNHDGQDWFGASFSKSDHGWEYKDRTVTVSDDFENVGIYVKYMNQSGQAWFDDIKVSALGVSNALMSEYNIAQNSSFEYDLDATNNPDGWEKILGSGVTATMTYEQGVNNAYIGTHAVSIANSSGLAVYASMQREPLRSGATYTATAMVKADGVTTGGGILKFVLYDANGTPLTEKATSPVSGTTGWTRVLLTLTESEAKSLNSNAASIKAVVGTNSSTSGKVYFDAIRLQANPIATNITYNAAGNYVISETDPSGDTTAYQTDSRGNVTRVDSPITGSYNVYGYDGLDRMTYEENATNLGIVYKYDANGNITQIDYQNNGTGLVVGTILKSYDELDRMTEFRDQRGQTTSYRYDPNGNIAHILHPNSKAAHFSFDALNRLTNTSYTGDSTTWSYSYDNNSNITQVVKNGSETTNITIDPDLDQVQNVVFPSINGVRHSVAYGYNPSGQVTSINNSPAGTVLYDYDQSGRLSNVTGANGQSAAYMFDESGQIKKIYTYDGSQKYNTYFDYNEAGLPSRMSQVNYGGSTLIDDTFLYDASGNRTEIRHQDGSKEVYEYDLSSRLTREYHKNPSGAITSDISYSYDVMGNRLTKTEGATTTTYTYDSANQLTGIGGTSLSYDNNGNMTSDGSNTFEYNAENQLVTVKNASQITIATYEYDHEGYRTKKVSGGVTERYYYNAGHLAYIADGSNNLRYSFTRDASGRLLTMTDHTGASPANYFYVLNDHGDILGLRDSSGTMVVTYSYDAFGISTATGTATTGDGRLLRNENPFRYASYVFDEETYYYYLNARYYNPYTGRFITRDEIPNANPYVYADNNPVMYVDPDGHLLFLIPVIVWAYYAWSAYDTYTSIKNDPSAGNIALNAVGLLPGGKAVKILYKSEKLLKKLKNSKKIKLKKGRGYFNDYHKIQKGDNKTVYTLSAKTNWMDSLGMKQVRNTKRKTWQDKDGYYWQWDSRHGRLEKWDSRKKKHLGEFDAVTGKPLNPGIKSRTFDE